MKLKMIVSALLNLRNILLFFLGLFAAGPVANLHPPELVLFAALSIYLTGAIQSLSSKKFHENFNRKQKIKQIRELNNNCLKLTHEAKKYVNAAYYQKLQKVIQDKNEILSSFFKGERNYLKERVVEQTLNLVGAYVKLLTNFCMRSKELSNMDVTMVTERINTNTRKLSFVKDPLAAEDLQKIVDMDQRIIQRLKEERTDLERIDMKLDYMASTVNMFKHQILSSIETQDMLETLETAVNEATALDNVLGERRRNRINA
ncbi:MAG: hypothetical protein N2645_04055 [Clostridia bacterium]|nr:hypothetical protein [Clostridia bacterium]